MPSLRDAIIALSPLVYLRCDEGGGSTLADASGNGRDFAITGTPEWLGAGLAPGAAVDAIKLAASSASIADAEWNSLTGAFSMCGMVRWGGASQENAGPFRKSDVGFRNGYYLETHGVLDVFDTQRFVFMTMQAGGNTFCDVAAPDPGDYFLVATFDGSTGHIYINGVDTALTGWNPTGALTAPTDGDAALSLAAFDNYVSDAALWGRALDASEVSAMWDAARTPPSVPARYRSLEVLPGSTFLVNASIITRDGLDDVRAADEESVAVYGHRAVTVDVALADDGDAADLADFHANRRSVPTPVVARVDAVIARESADTLEALAALDLGTLAQVERTTVDGRPLLFSATVESLDWDLRPGRQSLSLSTAPSDTYGLYGSASWFVIGESLLGGTAVLAPY